jgi:tetratricopeptide (TPR) repeat protein
VVTYRCAHGFAATLLILLAAGGWSRAVPAASSVRRHVAEAERHLDFYARLGQADDLRQAIAHAERALAESPGRVEAELALYAALSAELEEWKGEAELIRRIEQLHGSIVAQRPDLGDEIAPPGLVAARSFWNRRLDLDGEARLQLEDAAIAAATAAAHLLPDYAPVHWFLVSALEERGRYEEAVGAIGEVLRLEPGSGRAYAKLGEIQATRIATGSQCGHPPALDQALRAYRRAVALAPDLAEGHAGLSDALGRAGHHELAVFEARQALRLDGGDGEAAARRRLAAALGRAGRPGEGLEVLRDLLARAPGDAAAHGLAGVLHLLDGDAAQAVESFDAYLTLAPWPSGELMAIRDVALREMGRAEQANLPPATRTAPRGCVAAVLRYQRGEIGAAALTGDCASGCDPAAAQLAIGHRALLDGDAAAAGEHFRDALRTGDEWSWVSALARARLARLGPGETGTR